MHGWSIYETHYDACGHYLKCSRQNVDGGCVELNLKVAGSKVLLIRLVPHSPSAYNAMQQSCIEPIHACWVDKNVCESTISWSPVWSLQPTRVNILKQQRDYKEYTKTKSGEKSDMRGTQIKLLHGLKYYWQKKAFSGEDNICVRELRALGA